MIQYLCDLCGKPIKSEGRLFKIKEYKSSWHERYWINLLAHDECVKAIVAAKAVITDPCEEERRMSRYIDADMVEQCTISGASVRKAEFGG